MTETLSEIIDAFQSVDVDTRLELLLDFSKQLPPLDERRAAERDAGLHRVPECMSPVFLWVEPGSNDDSARIILDVAEEAPTVKGFLSIIVQSYDEHRPEEIRNLPLDLVNRLGLSSVIRMNRAHGIAAIITRIRNAALQLEHSPAHEDEGSS